MRAYLSHRLLFVFAFLVLAQCTWTRKADIYLQSQKTELIAAQIVEPRAPARALTYDIAQNPKDALLFITGSGCASLQSYLPVYLEGFEGSFRVFAMEKPGVERGDLGLLCTENFWLHNTFDERLKRNRQLLQALIESPSYDHIVIMGVSEGGPLAAALIQEFDSEIDGAMIIGAGGLPQRESLTILKSQYNAPFDAKAIDQKIANYPMSLEKIYGQTVRYWASFLDVSINDLLKGTQTPIMVVMGENDQSEPIQSLDALEAQGFENVRTLKVPNADHVLIAGGADQKPAYFAAFLNWLAL